MIIVRVLVSLIWVLSLLFGFFIEQPCNGIDIDSLWCAMHPASAANILGFVLWTVSAAFVSLLWKSKHLEIIAPPGSSWPNYAGLAVGALGIILMFV